MRGLFLLILAGMASGLLASPFGVRVRHDTRVGGTTIGVELVVPEKHLIYAASFSVTSDVPLHVVETAHPHEKADPFEPGKRVLVYTGDVVSRWQRSEVKEGSLLRVAFQGCNEQTCFMPEQRNFRFNLQANAFVAVSDHSTAQATDADFWVAGRAMTVSGGYMTPGAFLAFLDQAEGRETTVQAGLSDFLQHPIAFFQAQGIVLTLILVVLGGLLLNLTPCVLPMIPINLAILGAGRGTRQRGFLLGGAYGAGIVLVYGGSGWLILRSGLFFGALQASPWFSLAVAVIFAVLALALFDRFTIDFTRWTTSSGNTPARQGLVPAFIAGGVSALLAGACVAPVVLAVLLLAGTLHAQGEPAAQFLPFLLGLGMALPWPFAGAGLAVLPRPGMWMVRVKQAFGVLLVVLALYYAWLAVTGFVPAWGAHRPGSLAAGDRAAWSAAVAQAQQAGLPVFVDFWASWCKNCTAMENTTFQDNRVQARMQRYHVINVQVERPNEPAARAMLDAFGIKGLPAFVILQ